MKTCNCGMPIYDEPEQPSDKCRDCIEKKLDKVGKRLFTRMNIKDKPNVIGNAEK